MRLLDSLPTDTLERIFLLLHYFDLRNIPLVSERALPFCVSRWRFYAGRRTHWTVPHHRSVCSASCSLLALEKKLEWLSSRTIDFPVGNSEVDSVLKRNTVRPPTGPASLRFVQLPSGVNDER